jgi:hypothetical protein
LNLEWSVDQSIVSPYGTVLLNQPMAVMSDGMAWLFDVAIDGYQIVPAKFRPVSDSFSQADGSSLQPPYIDGMVATMEVAYWVCPNGVEASKTPACDEDLRLMDEFLMGCLNSLRTLPTDPTTQQYRWRPSGSAEDRLLNGVMLGAWPVPDFSKGPPEVRLRFELASPYPFAVDDLILNTAIASGASAQVWNHGNCDALPVIRANGSTSAFVLEDTDSGLLLSYDSSRPGAVAIAGGHYAEIDFFAGSVEKDGSPLEANNLIAGLDPSATNLFPLPPGATTLAASGAAIDVYVQSSFV